MSKLATKATSPVLNKFERKISGQGPTDPLYSFQMKIWMILLQLQSLEKSALLTDGVTKTGKHEIKNEKVNFLGL